MMSKFKVGDKVKIIESNLRIQREYIGRVREVVNTDSDGVLLDNMPDNDNYWLDSELELAQEQNLYGEPVFDYKLCCKNSLDDFKIQNDFYNSIVNGIWDKQDDCIDCIRYYVENFKEEKDMNKVLNLWYERKKNKIDERYKLMEVQFYNDKYSVVGSFNELIEKFNQDLEDLYKLDKATEQFVLKENAPNNVIKYCLDLDSLKERFNVEYLIEKNKEIEELGKIKEEVEAQLSLSNDLQYQQEVLINYGIINKKTKKISE